MPTVAQLKEVLLSIVSNYETQIKKVNPSGKLPTKKAEMETTIHKYIKVPVKRVIKYYQRILLYLWQ
jgi:hypothetical protein